MKSSGAIPLLRMDRYAQAREQVSLGRPVQRFGAKRSTPPTLRTVSDLPACLQEQEGLVAGEALNPDLGAAELERVGDRTAVI